MNKHIQGIPSRLKDLISTRDIWEKLMLYGKHILKFTFMNSDKNREGCLCCDFYFDFTENNFYTTYSDQGFLSSPLHSFNSMPSVSFFLENK